MSAERLAGVTVLDVRVRGRAVPGYVFDPHRLALPSWAHALGERPAALLITLDRHADLVAPVDPVPARAAGLRALDEHARWTLDVRNVSHVLAAMEAGLVGDALCLARTRLPGAVTAPAWTDRHGVAHRLELHPTPLAAVEALQLGRGAEPAWLLRDTPVLLDVDLDAFTSPSDADPTEILPWPRDAIRRFLLPDGDGSLWDLVLPRLAGLTFAREPLHVGGIAAAGRLWEDAAHVLFREVLGTDPP
ncbi:MAG: UPF0489 family protein [Deltaproteobacteria bacterium]|nr:UPF0489 family protein [Deltaproteobacteria bacterium]